MISEVISIDGPSGSGKTSVAKLLSIKLGSQFISSGSLYRTIANAFIELNNAGKLFSDGILFKDLYQQLSVNNIRVLINELNESEGYVEIKDLESEEIYKQNIFINKNYSANVTELSSGIAQFSSIRNSVNIYLKDVVAESKLTVVEGRDIGSVVFKDAKLKIFIDSPLELRAKRRLSQSSNNEGIEEIIRRDTSDSTRENSPLIIPDGALIILNENQSIEEIVETVLKEYKKL